MARSVKISSTKMQLFKKAAPKYCYIDGQKTDQLESITIEATCPECDVKIILPPHLELLREIETHFQFGSRFSLEELFEVEDIQVSIYKDELSVKIYANLRREER